ncbi:unnamed protein product [Kluyveromyces dobzhanskii CBS 2104]|uniref:WGS project CCBQ000000000 data, contig 00272 n=1 Tax=Kluyveromyces dobzhanskii CBS 2104 TaxID=1427455 RepID=A0A0A8LB70_9SACH|nr:unnamed protein product [Kluyveromyces dobzhanskii CBS 2104]
MTEAEYNTPRETTEVPTQETTENVLLDEPEATPVSEKETQKTDSQPVGEPAEEKPKPAVTTKASHWKPGSLGIKSFTGYALNLRCWKNADKEKDGTTTAAEAAAAAAAPHGDAGDDTTVPETTVDAQEKIDSKPDNDDSQSQSESETSETQLN